MILIDVIKALGLLGAAETYRNYDRMVETWKDTNVPIPTLEQCETKWEELVASGMYEPPYNVKREEAYIAAGLTLQKIAELTAEYTQALAANNVDAINKYSSQLAEVFAQRQAIKTQYPKP